MSFEIVGQSYGVEEFRQYVGQLQLSAWVPRFLVIHNTASPNLAGRPEGLTRHHIEALRDYYAGERGWKGGPHLFVDDRQIWVFNPLDRRGVHSPSWNNQAWGVEILGDYDTESPVVGRGAAAVSNGAAAAAILLSKIGAAAGDHTVRFHKEDTLTTHACPGKLLLKPTFLAAVASAMTRPSREARQPGWTVYGPTGKPVLDDLPTGERGTAIVRATAEALGALVQVDAEKRVLRLVRP